MNRWWAPEKPSDTPDDVTRAALLPLGDGTDQTSVLLALHRADSVASGRSVAHVDFCERVLREGVRL